MRIKKRNSRLGLSQTLVFFVCLCFVSEEFKSVVEIIKKLTSTRALIDRNRNRQRKNEIEYDRDRKTAHYVYVCERENESDGLCDFFGLVERNYWEHLLVFMWDAMS